MLKSQKGLSLIELMVVIGIVSVVMAALTSLGSVLMKQQSQSTMTFQTDNTRRVIVSLLNNAIAWDKTTRDAANAGGTTYLDCIPNRKPCTTSGNDVPSQFVNGAPINVIDDPNGTPVFDFRDQTKGYDMTGQPCSGFVRPTAGQHGYNGTDSCPLRFEVTWTASCGSSCINPMPSLSVVALYNPSPGANSKNLAFNNANYSSTFYQGAGESCWNLQKGGLIDSCVGNVGVGLPSPTESFETAGNIRADGQLTTGSFVGASNAVDWNNGNQQTSSAACGAAYTFANMRDGGTYSLVVTENSTTVCTFSTAITGTGAGVVSYYFRPPNNVRAANTATTYTFMRIGSSVYVSWASGFK